jgi:trehalose 2-sulfotransferase
MPIVSRHGKAQYTTLSIESVGYLRMSTSYLVCATPRSGSTLLCEALKAMGVAGRPEEYFEVVPATGRPLRPEDYLAGLSDPAALALIRAAAPPGPPPYSSLAGVASYEEHLRRVRDWGTTPNGVFGAKLMWDHVDHLQAVDAGRPPAELLAELFDGPRYVWVRRGDVVRQAVSLWRAMQTQAWRHDSGATEAGVRPRYCFPALRHLVARLTDHDARWGGLLATVGAPVLRLSYEELTADLPGALERTARHIGVSVPTDRPPAAPAMRRQADELSEAWVAAYARDAHLDTLPAAT